MKVGEVAWVALRLERVLGVDVSVPPVVLPHLTQLVRPAIVRLALNVELR